MKNTFLQEERTTYQSLILLGKGAQGEVFLVKKEDIGLFAKKRIRSQSAWKREVFFLKAIKHPAFPVYYDSWWEEDAGVVIMEYVAGQSLEDFINRRRQLSAEQILYIAKELACALVYLQQQNPPIYFRDIKPGNIRVGEDGKIRIIDCGAACFAENFLDVPNGERMGKREGMACVDLTAKTTRAGTFGYAAPEQFEGAGKVGAYSDVYAFGKLLGYMLEQRGKCSLRPWEKIRTFWLRKRLHVIAKGCMQEEITKRFPNMAIVLHKLCTRERVLQRVIYEKNICIHNL